MFATDLAAVSGQVSAGNNYFKLPFLGAGMAVENGHEGASDQ